MSNLVWCFIGIGIGVVANSAIRALYAKYVAPKVAALEADAAKVKTDL